MEALLRFDNGSKQYPNGVHALNGVSFTVGEGEFISVMAPPVRESPPCCGLLTG